MIAVTLASDCVGAVAGAGTFYCLTASNNNPNMPRAMMTQTNTMVTTVCV